VRLSIRHSHILLVAVLGGALSGCVNLAPDYQRPVPPVPLDWKSRGAVDVRAAHPSNSATDWNDLVADERLRKIIARTLDKNRDLRVAVLNIERARAQSGIASAALYPQIGVSMNASRSATPADLTSSGERHVSMQHSVDLGFASYEIDFFGRVRNLSEAALQNFFATEEAHRSLQLSLIASVATAWIQLATDQQRLSLARQTLETRWQSLSLVERSHMLGAQSGLALAQARGAVESSRLDVATYQTMVEQDRNAMELLAGSGLEEELMPVSLSTADFMKTTRLLVPPPDLPSSVLLLRPDVLAAEHALRAGNADIGAARAAFFPRVALTGTVGSASGSLSGLFSGSSASWNFAPSISLPIFDAGERRNALGVSEAQRNIAIADYEKTIQIAFREVADALAERRMLAERIGAQQAFVASTEKSLALADALFKGGGGSYLEVLDAQRSLYAAQQALIGLQLVDHGNRIALYRALGGNFGANVKTQITSRLAGGLTPG
jgi:multidrug efflux system outer membrane protein